MYTLEDMKKLNELLKKASDAYYNHNTEIMSNKEYDDLYDKLLLMEEELGGVLPDSVTQGVGFKTVSGLVKEKHEEKALSLDKTKDRQGLAAWLGTQNGCMSWKLDGLTVVATYEQGKLLKAVTRGDGETGEIVTHNARYAKGLPRSIEYKGHLVVRGEAVMTYQNFERVNAQIADVAAKYKNPRNLASGTLRALDSKVAAQRGLNFFAFELVTTDGKLPTNSFCGNLEWLSKQGFTVVEHIACNSSNVVKGIEYFEKKIRSNNFPSDGLVLQIDDIAYGKSLGVTGKFPRSGKAFKWQDETAETVIRKIEWQASRTGLINPVAVFDPVELEGTVVQRATANNISFMQKLHLSVGSTIKVYKANMIIPTIAENIRPVGRIQIPAVCPCCGQPTKLQVYKEATTLVCPNPLCSAKNIKGLVHYVSRDAMNMVGIAESTIDTLSQNGLLSNPLDLYLLCRHPEIAELEGFGEGSYRKLIESVEKSKDTTLDRYIYAWGIEQIGRRASKDIAQKCGYDAKVFVQAMDNRYNWTEIDGFGEIMVQNLNKWWSVPTNRAKFIQGLSVLRLKKPAVAAPKAEGTAGGNNQIAGKTFCVTGSVYIFANRNELGAYIEARGGKLASSVSTKTDYLVTNDTTSGSAKNKKAQELGKPILTEEALIALGGGR